MNTKYLFPHRFKKIGWLILIPSSVIGLLMLIGKLDFLWLEHIKIFALLADYNKTFIVIENNISDEIIGILVIIGAIMAACSKEKYEDEYIAKIRLESLLWATYLNYGFLILTMIFIYGFSFYTVMVLNIFTLLIIFLIRFNFILYKTANYSMNEK